MAVGNLTPGPHTQAASTLLTHHLASLLFLLQWGLTSQHRLVSNPHYDSASQLLGWRVFLTAANHQTFLHLIADTVIMIRWAWSGVLLSICPSRSYVPVCWPWRPPLWQLPAHFFHHHRAHIPFPGQLYLIYVAPHTSLFCWHPHPSPCTLSQNKLVPRGNCFK